MTKETIHINVPALARVEGEGALTLDISDSEIRKLELRIFEPPRYFEKILVGRDHRDIVDIVARICGICPVAYQVTAVQAIANAYGIVPEAGVKQYRRLLYCGEWIQSHSLHIHLLALPDFLGFSNVLDMSKKHPDVVHRGLRIQKAGNRIMEVLGGRSVHPVGLHVTGFYSYPDAAARAELAQVIDEAIQDAEQLLEWVSKLELPDDRNEICYVALGNDKTYPIEEGNIISSKGHRIEAQDFEKYFDEHQVPYSTALHCLLEQEHYLVGPLARFKLNQHLLPDSIQEYLQRLRISVADNSFHSLVARAIETLYALHEAKRLLETGTDLPPTGLADYPLSDSTGYSCTEAPRGLLWQKYQLDSEGKVVSARIVPPTSQNQGQIEHDLLESLTRFGLDKDKEAIRFHAEKIIRNYDPCISCSTHFLQLDVRRHGEYMQPVTELQTLDTPPMASIAIIGIGSPVTGDHQVEELIQKLKSRLAGMDYPIRKIIYLERPGLNLEAHLEKDTLNVIIDTLAPETDVRDIQYIDGRYLNGSNYFANETELPLSSHQIGVLDTISLRNMVLEDKRIIILGLPIGYADQKDPDAGIVMQLTGLIEKLGKNL